MPQYFDLQQYTLRRQEKALDKLLKLIQDIVSKHTESDVLKEASKCLAYLCEEDNPTYSRCNITRSAILDSLADQFLTNMSAVEALTEVDDNEIFPLMVSLKRLAAFAECHDITNYDIVKSTLTVLKWVNDNEGFAHDFFTKALSLARSIITWTLKNLNTEAEENQVSSKCFFKEENYFGNTAESNWVFFLLELRSKNWERSAFSEKVSILNDNSSMARFRWQKKQIRLGSYFLIYGSSKVE